MPKESGVIVAACRADVDERIEEKNKKDNRLKLWDCMENKALWYSYVRMLDLKLIREQAETVKKRLRKSILILYKLIIWFRWTKSGAI